jgi:MFS family permease
MGSLPNAERRHHRHAARPMRRPYFRLHGVPIRVPRPVTSPATGRPPPPPQGFVARAWNAAFLNRNFALLWWGQAISSVGDYAWDTALLLWVVTRLANNQSWAPLAVAVLILAAAIPQIVVGPIAGVFVDRWDKRRTMVVTTVIETVLAGVLVIPVVGIALGGGGQPHLPGAALFGIVCADILLITSSSQFYLPAQLALIKDIVKPSSQDQAIEMTQAVQALAVVIGPPVAAALVFGLGVEWALLLNSATFIVSLVTTVAIKAPPSTSSLAPGEVGHFSREFAAGVGYVLRHTVVRTILIAEMLTWLGFGALQSLGYFFITENLNAPPSSYGWFGATFGLGAVLGGVLVTIVGRSLGLARVLWVSLITSGIFVTVMSHLTSFGPALVAAFFFGVSATAILISAGPLAIDATTKEFVGRVTAVINPMGRLAALVSVVIAGSLVGTVLSGFHASVLGIEFDAVSLVFTGTGLVAILGGLYTRRHLREATEPGKLEERGQPADEPASSEAAHAADAS